MADDSGARDTSILFLELESGSCFAIATLSTRRDTQVIAINQTSGALEYSCQSPSHNFASEAAALQSLQSRFKCSPKRLVHGKAILGYAVFGNAGFLLLATKTRASIPSLPTADCVYTILESRWLRISLKCQQFLTREEEKNLLDLINIPIDEMHFFCETMDLTRPFPSSASISNPDNEFVWNSWLSTPFAKIGLPYHPVVLLQGIADSRKFTDDKGRLVAVALIARRSRFHPGTRFLARGLNAAYSTGNEVECEQLVWLCGIPFGRPLQYSTYVWRRGTVPIWWKAELQTAISEVDIIVSAAEPYRGAVHYFRRLVQRYRSNSHREGEKSLTPIFCINLLERVIGRPEYPLSWHFQESINLINDCKEIPEAKLCILNFDWHTKFKLLGDAKTVSALWQLLKDPASEIGLQVGEIQPLKKQSYDNVQGRDLKNGRIRILEQQNGIFRFNCADSIDRTNCASFFVSIQILGEQCRRLGIVFETNGIAGKPQTWGLFNSTFHEFRDVTLSRPVSLLADLFVIAGDIHAMLYTGSRAMHSQIIQSLGKDGSAYTMSSAAHNLLISLQRRYTNIVLDAVRQKQIEMFLGLRKCRNFPSVY